MIGFPNSGRSHPYGIPFSEVPQPIQGWGEMCHRSIGPGEWLLIAGRRHLIRDNALGWFDPE
jgi:hypothetical protein